MNTELRYFVDAKELAVEEVYIAPRPEDGELTVMTVSEWDAWQKSPFERRVVHFYGIEPSNMSRTGKTYNENDLFKTRDDAEKVLAEHIRSLLHRNREEIERLECENDMLTEKLYTAIGLIHG